MDARGEHRAWAHRAVAAPGCGARGRHRIRRSMPAPCRSRRREIPAPHRTDGALKFRRRSSLLPRAPWPNGIERTEPLRGQLWTRSERALKPPDVHWAWRVLAAAAAGLEIALLVWLWFGPALALRSVQVTGAHHLSATQVKAAAGISSQGSVISIDG